MSTRVFNHFTTQKKPKEAMHLGNLANPDVIFRSPDLCDFLREDLSCIYDILPIGYLILDGHGRIITINHTAANMLGKPRRHLCNTSLSSHIDKKEQKLIRKNGYGFADLIRSGSVELKIGTRKKETWARFSRLENIFRHVDDHIHLAVQDITVEKQTQQELGWQLKVTAEVDAISKVLSQPVLNIKNITRLVLAAAINLTQSNHGFISRFLPGFQRPMEMTLEEGYPNHSDMKGCTMKLTLDADGRYSGLLGQCLNTLKPFFTNPPHEHHPATQLPRGHITINSFLSVPIVIHNRPQGMIALANTDHPYSQRHVKVVTQLSGLYRTAVLIDRTQAEKAELELELYRIRQGEATRHIS